MRATVVYESMYGNTHAVAGAIGKGLREAGYTTVSVVPVTEAPGVLDETDLVVVGGPTHAHGMTSNRSRNAARDTAAQPDSGLALDPDAEGPGLREWLSQLPSGKTPTAAAAFDTRVDAPALVTGRASKGIARRLRQHGVEIVVPPESFLVDRQNQLVAGEAQRAEEWAKTVAHKASSVAH